MRGDIGPIPDGDLLAAAPDLYMIVLDSYAGARALRERFGFDNRPFLDSLNRLGFRTPSVRSNYPQTSYSLASMLNMMQVNDSSQSLGKPGASAASYFLLARRSRLSRFLQASGYRIYVAPTLAFLGTRHNDYADVELRPAGVSALRQQMDGWQLRVAVLRATWPGRLLLAYTNLPFDPELVVRQFEAVRDVVPEVPPKFVFLHSLITHPPYLVNADCHRLHRPAPWGDERAYLATVRCTNRLLLEVVTAVQSRSARPAVIILQADHGAEDQLVADSGTRVSDRRLAWRFDPLGAYYLPGSATAAIGDTITPVNVLGIVLREYLGARVELAPDRSYYPTPANGRFVDVTARIAHAEDRGP
jgi:hypothetical protein